MSLTKVSFSMIEGAYANVLDYGAVGDGATNDTAAIQAAVNASDCVYFPPGKTYMVSSISIRAGMSLVGYSATLKLLANQTKFVRILTTQNNLLDQVVDSEPLNIVGLTLDGNRVNQGP
jgi:polygalacturonase